MAQPLFRDEANCKGCGKPTMFLDMVDGVLYPLCTSCMVMQDAGSESMADQMGQQVAELVADAEEELESIKKAVQDEGCISPSPSMEARCEVCGRSVILIVNGKPYSLCWSCIAMAREMQDEEEKSRAPPPPPDDILMADEVEQQDEFPSEAVSISEYVPQRPSSQLALGSQSSRISTRSSSQSVLIPTKKKTEERRPFVLVYHSLYALGEYLWYKDEQNKEYVIKPPPASRTDYFAGAFYNKTEDFGKYLIRRGFPLIGRGAGTLCFLLTDELVAKVAHYDDERGKEHYNERNRDLLMTARHPAAFAETQLMLFSDEDANTYKVYVQERLDGPFIHGGLDPDQIEYNSIELNEMIEKNRHSAFPCKQFGRTRVRKMYKPIGDYGDVSIALANGREQQWLVCFDYI